MPEVDKLFGIPQALKPNIEPNIEIDCGEHALKALQIAAQKNAPLPIRFATLTLDLGKGMTPSQYLPQHPRHERQSVELLEALCERLRVPNDCRDLAITAARWQSHVHASIALDAESLLAVLDGTDALRRPARFMQLLDVCACDHDSLPDVDGRPYLQHDYLRNALTQLQSLDQAAVAKLSVSGNIGDAVQAAKLKVLQQFTTNHRNLR